ncbi:MAG: hypothetical protein C0602_08440 [Denitrovibrio sp.]|nr:MAG: hypothetical protein C0602_08440 [Denitrovibrio sp.]
MLIKAFKSIWSTTKKANSLKKEFETKFVEDCNVKINNRHRDFLKKLLYNLDSPESPYGPRALELYLNHLGIPLTVEEEETLIEQPPSASEIQEMFHILEMLDGIPTID